jgi:YggT family protein
MIALASVRNDAANYVQALFEVYILVLVIYILANLVFAFGLRPPYSRYTDAVLGFLRDVSEPYLRVFRRVIPSLGMFDFSPIVAIFLLVILDRVIYSAIHT